MDVRGPQLWSQNPGYRVNYEKRDLSVRSCNFIIKCSSNGNALKYIVVGLLPSRNTYTLVVLMNIFVLDRNPELAARYQCDKHVVKMVLETAQLLCAQFEPGAAPYRRTHYSHPCSKWVRRSRDNFIWLWRHGVELAREYTFRYGKVHKSLQAIHWAAANEHLLALPDDGLTDFAQAMPDVYKRDGAPVTAYREYYKGDKASFAKWTRRPTPQWFKGH